MLTLAEVKMLLSNSGDIEVLGYTAQSTLSNSLACSSSLTNGGRGDEGALADAPYSSPSSFELHAHESASSGNCFHTTLESTFFPSGASQDDAILLGSDDEDNGNVEEEDEDSGVKIESVVSFLQFIYLPFTLAT